MGHHIINEVKQEKFEFSGRAKMIAIVLFVVGAILAGVGAMNVEKHWDDVHTEHSESHEAEAGHAEEHGDHHATLAADESHAGGGEHTEDHSASGHGDEAHASDHHGPTWMTRVWANLLLNSYYFWLFAVGALFFIAVNYVANAGWAVMLKRIMEAQTAYLGIGSIILFAVIILGKDYIYLHWVPYFDNNVGGDAILDSKHWLLNNTSLYVVIPAIFAIWYFVRHKLRSFSTSEDADSKVSDSIMKKSTGWSAGFLFFFAFSFSAISWLVIMSIDSHWYSTMFSVYNFAISFVTALSVMMLLLQYLKSKGYMEMVSDEVVHDLGKFMFAFCIFWTYIFLSQWLLIWYTNLPEETVYFDMRLTDHYKPLFFLNIAMCFVLPFFGLMMRNAKRHSWVLLSAALIIVIGHWVDTYMLIMPGTVGEKAGIGMLEIGTTMAFAGLFIYIVLHSLSKANLYPVNHPYVLESANHDVGP